MTRKPQTRRDPDPERTAAANRLQTAIADRLEGGEFIPCVSYGAGDMWISDDPDDQRFAARACLVCPAFTECWRYITAWPELAGVWAGRVMTEGAVR